MDWVGDMVGAVAVEVVETGYRETEVMVAGALVEGTVSMVGEVGDVMEDVVVVGSNSLSVILGKSLLLTTASLLLGEWGVQAVVLWGSSGRTYG